MSINMPVLDNFYDDLFQGELNLLMMGFRKGDIENMPIEDVIDSIIDRCTDIREFWTNAHGWAPIEAANLLGKSRLDWQVSLSKCLKLWLCERSCEKDEGQLILAWANLGSLVEGTMKLFLSVYHDDYIKDSGAFRNWKSKELIDPDILTLEQLIRYFKENDLFGYDKSIDWTVWIQKIQQRRNAIHAYKNRDIVKCC